MMTDDERNAVLEEAAMAADADANASRSTLATSPNAMRAYEEGRIKGGNKIAERIRAMKKPRPKPNAHVEVCAMELGDNPANCWSMRIFPNPFENWPRGHREDAKYTRIISDDDGLILEFQAATKLRYKSQ